MNADPRPIGLFDSGLGGLTVLRALARAFPEESFLYLGDVARLPYGNKSPETIRRYGEQSLDFLLSRGVKLLIIACNTASTVFVGQDEYEGVPLFNVIHPGAEAALTASRARKVGVIGTHTTIQGHAYRAAIHALDPACEVVEVACPLFVPLAEEGLADDEVTRLMASRYLAPLKAAGVDTLVLGCTHYPILRADIASVMGGGVALIESGDVLAQKLRAHFSARGGAAPSGTKRSFQLCTTDVTGPFERLARQLMAPEPVPGLERVVL